MEVALATSKELPDLDRDDQLLHRRLVQLGVDARPVIWNDPAVTWTDIPLCVIRSTWDYQNRRQEYLDWTRRIAAQTCLLNPSAVIGWNTDKGYLQRFEAAGIPVVPTFWLEPGSAASLHDILAERGWSEAVIKPRVSASAKGTHRVSLDEAGAGQRQLDALLAEQAVMIQPFLKSIETDGEYSLMFVEREFTHAIRKRPGKGDFRVQEELGGSTVPIDADPAMLELAGRIMDRVDGDVLYARVDLMRTDDGALCLSELELVEPSMHLRESETGLDRFARAIIARIPARKTVA